MHEGERLAIPGPLKRLHANAVMSNHDFLSNLGFVHWFTVSATIVPIKHNSDIHFNVFHVYPLPMHTHMGREICGGIKFGRQDSGLFNGSRLRIVSVQEDGAELLEFRKDKL